MINSRKYLGVCMDHATANLMELETGHIETKIITSAFSHQVKEQTLEKGEKEAHHKENHEELAYYKEIGKAILNYEDVLPFGPTEAKTELLNLMRQDHHFDKIKIEVKTADKMTGNQEHAFVRDYFINQ
ncbi:MAG TPA: hypothetical protein VKI61_10280 [Chitinophagaceae bacterium]|nr:hypothetical protein [Chitinophagaceae bacterium]